MAEGDTILRTARRLQAALAGQELKVQAFGPGRAAHVERLDGRRLERVGARGKHLLLEFDDLALHSHLGMVGSWHVYRRGAPWRKPVTAAWIVLKGEASEAVEFGGPTLRVLPRWALRGDPQLSRLGPDVLAAELDLDEALRRLRAAPEWRLGEALLDQHLLAGVGNIFKSEACFAACANPWRAIGDLRDEELQEVVTAARRLMQDSVARGRPERAVYRRPGRPCPCCGTSIAAKGQGDDNRRTYWCPRCQA